MFENVVSPRSVPSARVKLTETIVADAEPRENGAELWIADDMVPGFGLRVRPSGVKTFCFRYRTEGGRAGRTRRYTIGPPEKWKVEAARNRARKLLSEIVNGGDPADDRRSKREGLSLGETLDLFIEELGVTRKPSTIKHYTWLGKSLIKPRLGRILLESVKERDVDALRRSLAATPGNAWEVVKLLRDLYRWAQRKKRCPKGMDPTFGIQRHEPAKQERYLSHSELIRLGDVLSSEQTQQTIWPLAVMAIRLLLLTGARRGEIIGARWEWVDWEAKMLRLPDSKTGAKSIPLGSVALMLLRDAKQESSSPWVIPSKTDRSRPICGGSMFTAWSSIRKRARLEDVRIHDLRHTHASIGVGGGTTLFIVGKILGHSDLKTTERYAHLDDDPMRQAAEKISSEIAAALDGKPKAEVVEIREG